MPSLSVRAWEAIGRGVRDVDALARELGEERHRVSGVVTYLLKHKRAVRLQTGLAQAAQPRPPGKPLSRDLTELQRSVLEACHSVYGRSRAEVAGIVGNDVRRADWALQQLVRRGLVECVVREYVGHRRGFKRSCVGRYYVTDKGAELLGEAYERQEAAE